MALWVHNNSLLSVSGQYALGFRHTQVVLSKAIAYRLARPGRPSMKELAYTAAFVAITTMASAQDIRTQEPRGIGSLAKGKLSMSTMINVEKADSSR